jgi:cytochrome P450 family 6
MLARNDGKVTYDAVMSTKEMPFLHQIIQETLRLYPVLPMLDRVCIRPDGYSLEPFSDFKIPYEMPIYIPIYAMQRDEKYFPDPLKFNPDRFSPENIGSIQPFTYFPFGAGPRNCIGERLGLMQVKTGLVKILMDFCLEPTVNTPKKIVLEKKAMLVQSEKGLFLNLVKDPLF